MRSKYLINKFPNIIAGVVFSAGISLPIIAPVLAQIAPAITITKATTTPSISQGGAATYKITVTNAAGAGTATNVTISDVLPANFTFDSTLPPALSGSATRTSTSDPVLGSTSLTWNSFRIPAGGKVIITFTANNDPAFFPKTYQNSASVTYKNSSGSNFTANYDAAASTAEDVTVTALFNPTTPGTSTPPTVSTAQVCGKPGSDGVGLVAGFINTYFAPISTSAPAGTNTISLGQSVGSGNQINEGDLVMIIQMQDATINSSNSNLYGSGISSNAGSGQTDMGASGLYEYAVAISSVPTTGGTLTLLGKGSGNGLINSYTNATATSTRGQRRFQVIRVPQFASVTLSNTLSAPQWNGTTGGIVIVDVVGQFDFNSRTISTINAGFRAGSNVKSNGPNSVATYVAPSTTSALTSGSGKGEGTAGTPRLVWNGLIVFDNGADGYPSGDTGRGAPANAGGGGNAHNAGGGGGGNGGIGGQGGLPWEGAGGQIDAGGRPGLQSSLYAPVPWRLMMGGGGGGGEGNNATSGIRGGIGAGMVIIRAGKITGMGTILAYGDNGDVGSYLTAPDGAGGGGAGGSVLIQARNSSPTASIDVQAYGGAGGNTEQDSGKEHGPGGGGGGGVVVYSVPGGTVTPTITGGASGKAAAGAGTTHGATSGQVGQIGTLSNDPFSTVNGGGCLPDLIVTKVTSTPKVNRLGIAKYKITVTNTATIGNAIDANVDDPLPTGFTYSSTENIILTGTAPTIPGGTPTNVPTRTTVTDPAVNDIKPLWGKFTIPPLGKVEIYFSTKVGATVPSGTYNNPAESTYPDPARLVETGLITNTYYDFVANTGEDVTVNSNAQVLMVKRITAINGLATNPNDHTTKLDKFVHNTSSVVGVPINDQNCYWYTATPDAANPGLCMNTYTVGEVSAGNVKPDDTIEYTVYFVNAGGADAKKVKICDLLRPNQTYVPGSLSLKLGGNSIQSLTDANDTSIDRGQFVPANDPDMTKTSNCNLAALSPTNPNGVVAIDITGTTGSLALPQMPTSTTPLAPGENPAYYGWFRFRTTVNK